MRTLWFLVLSCLFVSPAFSKPPKKDLTFYIWNSRLHSKYTKPQPISPYVAQAYAVEIKRSCKEFGISRSWYASMLKVESEFNPSLNDGVKPNASYGIAQMQVDTARAVAGRLKVSQVEIDEHWFSNHPIESIRFGARHFKTLLNEFGGDYYWATRAYNGGDGRILKSRAGSKRWKHLSVNYYKIVERHFHEIKGGVR